MPLSEACPGGSDARQVKVTWFILFLYENDWACTLLLWFTENGRDALLYLDLDNVSDFNQVVFEQWHTPCVYWLLEQQPSVCQQHFQTSHTYRKGAQCSSMIYTFSSSTERANLSGLIDPARCLSVESGFWLCLHLPLRVEGTQNMFCFAVGFIKSFSDSKCSPMPNRWETVKTKSQTVKG